MNLTFEAFKKVKGKELLSIELMLHFETLLKENLPDCFPLTKDTAESGVHNAMQKRYIHVEDSEVLSDTDANNGMIIELSYCK